MAAKITDFSRLVYHIMDYEFEPSPEESCKSTFFSVVINTQHAKLTASISLLTGNVQGKHVLTFLSLQQFPFCTFSMSRYSRVALFLKLCYLALQVYYMCPVTTRTVTDIRFSQHIHRTIIFLFHHTALNS